eukprot:1143268-Pelagomonas_calceolata.AAC.3
MKDNPCSMGPLDGSSTSPAEWAEHSTDAQAPWGLWMARLPHQQSGQNTALTHRSGSGNLMLKSENHDWMKL